MPTPPPLDRRHFLATSAAAAAATAAGAQAMTDASRPGGFPAPIHPAPGDNHRGPCVIASGNGLKDYNGPNTVELAFKLITDGHRPVEACVRGVNLVEDDPEDMSVGYGGLPNEDGVIQLDAACMDGPLHKAGAVAALEDIKNPASVALEVLRRTDHVLLVGPGAKKFALRIGFPEQDLHTEASRKAWLDWRANLNREDKWLDADQIINFPEPWRQQSMGPPPHRGGGGSSEARAGGGASPSHPSGAGHISLDPLGNPHTYGTIHCSAVNKDTDLGCCTTTSGLAWKLPGRVGDSPLIGAGLYCDNATGSAGATGRGESVIHTLGSAWIVHAMERGLTPTEACLEACKRIVDRTHEPRMFDDNKRPRFSVTFYAVRKDGAYGSASILKGGHAAVCTDGKAQRLESEFLYE
ncbi:MAG: N(4)-(beta-N-acetylglucosaminyl)-L-asparaginase [Phycisphaerales bacterium]|nr:N(4)-(beta-N-acetylglucosaminyl)-L-asparaginase [Phycisphaerales bacterium]